MPRAEQRRDFWVVVLLVLPVLYGGGYLWARATHRLVHRTNGTITSPRNGLSMTTWELTFLPLRWLEEQVWSVVPTAT